MEIEGLDFVTTVKNLANQYNIDIQLDDVSYQSNDLQSKLFDIHEKASNIYYSNCNTEEGKNILEHLISRGINKKTIKDFTHSYYATRSKKIINLINQIKAKKKRKTYSWRMYYFQGKKTYNIPKRE